MWPAPSKSGCSEPEAMEMTQSRLPPFYCPYCGEEDIRPFGDAPGEWRCDACLRVWLLRQVGVARRDVPEGSRS